MPRLNRVFAGRTGHFVGFVMRQLNCKIELEHDKTNKITCAPSEASDQPAHWTCLISLCCALYWYLRTQTFFRRTAKTLIRLGGCPGWSESLLGTHVISLFHHPPARMTASPWYFCSVHLQSPSSCLEILHQLCPLPSWNHRSLAENPPVNK